MSTQFLPIFRLPALATIVTAALCVTPASRADEPSAGNEALFERLDANGDGSLKTSEVPSTQERLFARLVRIGDKNGDKALSRDEFVKALVPNRPEKKIETKAPDGYPEANAARYVLLLMDTSRNSWIESDEVPEDMLPVFEAMAERVDANENGTMDRYELSRGARDVGRVAARYVARERIDVAKELAKLEKSQGPAAKRFDVSGAPLLGNLADPRQARETFKQFDANKDGKLILAELPDPVQPQFERFIRIVDRDRDGGLSEREFLIVAERISRYMGATSGKPDRPKPGKDPAATRRALRRLQSASAEATPGDEMPAESMSAEDE
jgi:Ca2+-binding EF-hand superfamily protein